MSKYDEDRKKLGLQPLTTAAPPTAAGQSKYAAERERIFNPTPVHTPTPMPIRPMTSQTDFKQLGDDMRAKAFVEGGKATRAAQDPANKTLAAVKHATVDKIGEGVDRFLAGATFPGAPGIIRKPLNSVGRFVNQFSQGGGTAVGVDTQAAGAAPLASTGSKIADKTAQIAGGIAGFAVNPAQVESNLLTAPYRAAESALASRGGVALTQAAARGIGRLGVKPQVASTITQRGLTGATAGAVQGVANSGVRGETDVKDVALSAGLGAALGGVGDAAISTFGPGIKSAIQKLVSRKAAVTPEAESAASSALNSASTQAPARQMGVAYGRLTPASNEAYINKVMTDIKPIVTERMTPPLENPNELAKWLQPHLGDESLNEIRKLPYEDLRQLAEEVRRNLSTYDMAKAAAKERGYDLDQLLSNQTPSLKQAAERLRMGGVAGAIEPPRGNVRVATARMAATPEAAGVAPRGEPNTLPVSAATEEPLTPRPLPQRPSSQSLGISAFGGKAKPYDNLSTSTKSQLVTRQTKERPPLKTLKNKIYTSLVDDLDPLNRFDKEVERLIDKPLQPAQRSHTLALNSRGSDIIAKTILTENQVDAAGNVIGKSLKGILKDLPKNEHSYVDFEDYLVNKHAITRMRERGERVYRKELNWTPEQGEQIVADYDAVYPQFATMADELYQYQRNMVQHWLVDTRMIPQEQADAYFKANPTYVPNKRFFSELESAGGSKGGKSKRGIGNQSAPIKKYVPGGSERKIISPIEAIIENTDAFVKAARRNQAMQAFARNLERDPEALQAFGEFIPEEQVAGAQSLKELNKTLDEEGMEGIVAKLGEDFDINFRKATQRGLDKDNIIRVMVEGQPKYIQVNDKPTLEAITAMGPDGANAVMDFLGKVTSIFKTLTTGVNPVFSLTRNIMRDIPQAYAASKTTNNPFQFFADLATSAYAIARNKELYQEYKAIGGGHSSPASADRNLLKRSKDLVLPRDPNPLRGALPRGYRKLQEIMDAWETAPRLGEFKRLAESGTNADRQAGLAAAQDVTVNFKRRGRLGKQLDKVFPYFNAAVQGLDKTGRMFKDDWLKTSAKTALAVSLPAMISYAINYGNPNYDKVSKRTKDNFYLLPKGDGTFWKIAKPKEIGTVFADIPERLLDLFAKKDPDAFRDFASQVRTTFTPPGVQGALKSGGIPQRLLGVGGDTVLGPIGDVAANKNFAGAAIVPGYLKNLSPELQSDPRTSVVANKVGEWTGSSPKALDYLFRQYTGILGQLGQPLLSPGGSVGSALLQQVTADPVYSNDLSEKFYESMGHQDQAKSDYNVTGEMPADYNDGLRKYLNKISDAMGSIRKQMRAIEKDGSIPAGQKRDQLRVLQEQINQLAGQGNDAAASTK